MVGNNDNLHQSSPDPSQKPGEEQKNKLKETFENLKKNENVENLVGYAQTHTKDTIAYILLILGILWTFFSSLYGGILIGLVVGFYFSKEISFLLKSYTEFVERIGTSRSLILGGAAIAFFIAAPGIFIGMAIMVGLKIALRAD